MKNPANKLWKKSGWWNNANILEAIVDFDKLTGNANEDQKVQAIFRANRMVFRGGFRNSFYDDELWWALAWLKAYELYHRPEYLRVSERIFEDTRITTDGTIIAAAGVWWNQHKHYKNAIPNELFIALAAKLFKGRK